jgi:CheY-like chemotaxis protein
MNGHVLVVDDDDTIRRILVEYLEQHSHLEVDGARDGVEALHRISTRSYALVILDLMLPYMSGVDFLHSLVAMQSDPSVKTLASAPAVVIITGATLAELPPGQLEQKFKSLVRGVFRKPIDAEQLTNCVEGLLR